MCKALGSILLLAVTLARFGLPVAYADTVRSIATAEELAAALLDNSVSVARIDARHIDLSDAAFLAWDNSTFPFLRTANITILGNTDLPEWPLLQLRAKKKLMLADHVHFTLRWLYIYRWRNDNFVRLPGWDTLAPSKPDVCYPLPIMGANYGAVERPASVPGVQTYTLGLPQTGCVNDSSVLKNRCWSDFSMINDVIFVGYDNDLAGKPVPNNYLLNISHTQQLCRSMLDAECLKVNQPIACMLVAMRGAILSAPVTSWLAPSPAANATLSAPTASPAALTGPSGAAPQTDTEGGGGGEDNTTAIIVGSVVGGVAFLAIVLHIAGEVAKGLDYLAAYLAPPKHTFADARGPQECFDINNVVLTHQVAIAVHVTMNGSRLPMPPPSGALNAEAEAAARWPPKLTRLIRACWEKDPRRRPAAAEVVKQLALAAEALESGALVTANLTSGDFRSP
ncbi:hypothetical protein HYH03_005731 [Edaphochlamys debaryana]|uniref:Uncharacterized protein n=1 Tax=Edaphochlamys debaryana TaxID=47281 RepID=A0A835Y527_9CHLO|nr:hypothetical protein HYH03_005731 [Edaphochlamys debaryana]|eukprot:KAG2496128.1 hypothetical protein HYH03_005731 [Edaphochlamys debaryana]